jgi:hypothetical protein
MATPNDTARAMSKVQTQILEGPARPPVSAGFAGMMFFTVMPRVSVRLEATLRAGERRHHGRWRSQPVRLHIWRSVRHAWLWARGDKSEDHPAHCACRFLMAVELLLGKGR